MRHTLRSAGLALALMLPAGAWAAPGYVTGNVNLRAGPEVDYPAVLTIPAGSTVDIQGCLEDYGWCDVIAGGNRGWVAGNYIQYEYEQRRVYLPDYGPRIGIPIVTFAIGSYWDSYYRGRPFYGQRDRWYGRPPVHRPPPRAPSWGHGPGRPGWSGPSPRPPGHGGDGGRPPQWSGSGPGRPPQEGNNGPGRPPQQGDTGPGRPPQGGNAGPGRPPQSGGGDRGRPPQAGGQRPGRNEHGGGQPAQGGGNGDRRDADGGR